MNRNTIIGLLLIFAIFIGWSLLTRPTKEEREAMQRKRDSLLIVEQKLDSIQKAEELERERMKEEADKEVPISDEKEIKDQGALPGTEDQAIVSGEQDAEEKFYVLESPLLKITLSNKGGRIYSAELKKYDTYDSLPLILFGSDSSEFGLRFFANNRSIFTNNLYFRPYLNGRPYDGSSTLEVDEEDALSFAMRAHLAASDTLSNTAQYIEYVYTLKGDDYMLGFNINIVGLQDIIKTSGDIIDISWTAHLRRQEKSVDRFNAPTVYYKFSEGDVDYLSETKDDKESITGKVKWASFKQHFFASTIIANDVFINPVLETYENPNPSSDRYLKTMIATLGIPYSNQQEGKYAFNFYFGPLKYNVLRSYKLDLERQIPLGWSFFLMHWINRYAVIPVFNFLGSFGWNYGIIILVLTILLKTLLFPIAYKTYMSSAKMRVLKPEVEEINKKYPKKEDAMKKQQATMALYKKAGVNPLSGCIPMLLQLPILIAMFRFFPSSIELRQESFLWASDLSSYDSILDLPFNIPFYGDHVSLFTLLMTVSTIFYTRINNQMMSSSQQMPGMKTMMYIMPIMFLGIFNNYASALSYYYLLTNLITFGQMFIFRWVVDEDKIYKRIQEHKKKPVKKSGFQKRLEEAARKRSTYQKRK